MAKTKDLKAIFVEEIRDVYDAEKQLSRALPKLAKASTNPQLQEAFQSHLEETKNQILVLEKVFELLEETPRGKHCEGIAGIVEEGKKVIEGQFDDDARDAALIAGGQRAEHYEMAAYGTLVEWAKTLGHADVARELESILEQEKAADKKLSKLATSGINQAAATAAAPATA
jgi:ferritin-like metal-binding protein YciE